MSGISFTPCPLCGKLEVQEYHRDKRRPYLQCPRCRLVFVPSPFHLNDKEEKRIYDLHENDPYDEGYRKFLSRLTAPLTARLKKGAEGMDFGCGPGPALVKMLEERGYIMSSYDKFYKKTAEVFETHFDFICATEVAEHLTAPFFELSRLYGMLKPGGILALMTKLVIDNEAFKKWHYIQDQSHICFYSRETFTYLAEQYNCRLEFMADDVIFLSRET